jgi:hypothetical protein
MKAMQRTALALALAGAMALPAGSVMAAEPAAQEAQAAPAPESAQATPAATPDRLQAMRERMQQIRLSRDPEERMQLMAQQMKDMDALLMQKVGPVPMRPFGMMGPGMGGLMASARHEPDCSFGYDGMGMAMPDRHDWMSRRLDRLERRMDMMQMMLMMQMRMNHGMPAGMMGPGMGGMMGPGIHGGMGMWGY